MSAFSWPLTLSRPTESRCPLTCYGNGPTDPTLQLTRLACVERCGLDLLTRLPAAPAFLGQLGRATTLQIMLTSSIVCQRHGCPQGGAHTRAALATNPAARHLSSGERFRCYDEAERSRVSLPETTTHS